MCLPKVEAHDVHDSDLIGMSTQDLTLIPSGPLLPRRRRSRTRFAGLAGALFDKLLLLRD